MSGNNGGKAGEVDASSRDGVQATAAPPPEGNLSIVFTDIVKSTAIWEKDAAAMVEAMAIHDIMIRDLTKENDGYEVKQNGDGFMIAFPTATAAVQFCLDAQERLLDEVWPKGILNLPSGSETKDSDGQVLFRGLKLRMSAHWGEPVCNYNEVIKRMDYLGPMVNRAARFIQVTEGGQITVSEDFLLQLQGELEAAKNQPDGKTCSDNDSDKAETVELSTLRSKKDQKKLTHQQFEIQLLGEHDFKGLDEPEKLYYLVPRSLEGRVDHWHQVEHVPGVKGNVRS
ncbi:nucleotide cyclase [Exophiala viscosa]|uniref:Nucleotide cyclase n=1 Tax=Exophiala viscosa TaxID=2486360 RepID=A0AAN6E8J7_9EURO|nr:nucleotide cyclase [Exophiala viscosa]KAI1628155.1 nucleotide cyclase [Exophiala viscosa]